MSELLRRAVEILDQLRLSGGALGIREIAERVGLPKSSVQRILSDLVQTEMASQDPLTMRYRLGPRTLALGTAYQRGITLRTVALAHMRRLRDLTGETVGLSVAIGEEMMHVDQVESRSELRCAFEIGHPLPLWSGAPSRVLLADMDKEDVARIVGRRKGTDVTPAAPPTPEALLAAVEQTRTDGYSAAFDETIAGVSTLSAPIRGHAGHVIATVSITGPSSRFNKSAMKRAIPHLLATAAAISTEMGAA